MRSLVIGSGGREHAIAWRLSQDPSAEVFVYPGNAGMNSTPSLAILSEEVSLTRLFEIIRSKRIELVIIGPEKYLFEGWVDELRKKNISVYGPTGEAARLEGSKIYAKEFMREFAIPTAAFEVARSKEETLKAIESHPEWQGYVLKLSGPALGKGVIVTHSIDEAKEAAELFFQHKPPGIEDGLVIENFSPGKEVSLFYICNGSDHRFLASACDHKRLKDNDEGPNTGGMGAYSPCEWIDSKFLKQVETKIVEPTLQGMKKRGAPFTGTLFLGLMVSGDDFSLLEYNVRFGDPETQTFLPLYKGNLAELLLTAAKEKAFDHVSESAASLNNASQDFAIHVVKAAKGYPGNFGEEIEAGIPLEHKAQGGSAQWFFAGVKESSGRLITSGGRVCGVTTLGKTLKVAQSKAYAAIRDVSFSGEHFRTDIGGKP